MSQAARRAVGARPLEPSEVPRARTREQELRDGALATAMRYGPTDQWHAYWRKCGVSAADLSSIRTEVTLGGST